MLSPGRADRQWNGQMKSRQPLFQGKACREGLCKSQSPLSAYKLGAYRTEVEKWGGVGDGVKCPPPSLFLCSRSTIARSDQRMVSCE